MRIINLSNIAPVELYWKSFASTNQLETTLRDDVWDHISRRLEALFYQEIGDSLYKELRKL